MSKNIREMEGKNSKEPKRTKTEQMEEIMKTWEINDLGDYLEKNGEWG